MDLPYYRCWKCSVGCRPWVGDVYNIITCAKFHIEMFMGYDFSIEFCIGLTTVYVISGYGETLQSITNLNTA